MKSGSKRHMTLLERGLAVAAYREGKSADFISEALHRDTRTLRQLFKKHGCTRRRTGVKK